MNLYRKYRPKDFSEVIGQEHIKITLQNEIQDGGTTHAYLFCGPRAVGKTTISRVFSKALNCTNRKKEDANPCNECDMCKSINEGSNLDVIEIDAASHTGVDNVRENIIEVAKVAPSHALNRVFIIDEVHMLSISAFNALLKLLEEPPANVVFILCTTEVHKIPATIISRCQRFDFKKIAFLDIVKRLEGICVKEGVEVEKSVLEAVARHSEGHMRDAESLLGQVISISGKKITMEDADLIIPRSDLTQALELIKLISKKDVTKSIILVNKIVEDGIDLKVFLKDLIEFLRKMMLISINPSLAEKFAMELGEDLEKEITAIIPSLPINAIVNLIDKMVLVQNEIKDSFIVQLPLEIAITELCMTPVTQTVQTAPPVPVPQTPSKSKATPLPPVEKVSAAKNEPVVTSVVNKTYTAKSINLKDVQTKWPDLVAKIKQEKHSISFVLQACQPSEIIDGKVTLTFRYKFHKDRMDEPEVNNMVKDAMASIYESNLTITTALEETPDDASEAPKQEDTTPKQETEAIPPSNKTEEPETKTTKPGSEGMIDDLLKTFGGKVVN